MKTVKVSQEEKDRFIARCRIRFAAYEQQFVHWDFMPIESYQKARGEVEAELMALGDKARAYRLGKEALPMLSTQLVAYLTEPKFGFQSYLLVYLGNIFAFEQAEQNPPMVMH